MKYLIVLFMLSATPAFAVDFSRPVLTDEGKPICQDAPKEGDTCPADKVVTLGRAVRMALHASFPDEQNLSGEDKFKRAEIAQGLLGASEVKVKVEDLALIKKVVGKAYNPSTVFAIWNMLEK